MLLHHTALRLMRVSVFAIGMMACAQSGPTEPAGDDTAILNIDCSTKIHNVDGSQIGGKRGRSCRPVYLKEGDHRIGFAVEHNKTYRGLTVELSVACYSTLTVKAGESYTIESEFRDRSSPGKLSLMPDFKAWLVSDAGQEAGVTFCDNPASGNRWTFCSISKGFPKPISALPPHFPKTEFYAGRSGAIDFSASLKSDGSIRRVHSLVSRPVGFGGRDAIDAISVTWHFRPADMAALEEKEFEGRCEFRHPAAPPDSSNLEGGAAQPADDADSPHKSML